MSAPLMEDFYVFRIGRMWAFFRGEHFSFWMICCYLVFEMVRPQAIFPSINILPWAQIFIFFSMLGALIDPKVRWTNSSANIWITLFLLTIIASTFAAYYPEVSKSRFIDFFNWFIIYFLIINIINTKERFYIFLIVFVVASAKIALGTAKSWVGRGFSFTSWGLMGPRGYFQNSGELAILMLVLFPLAFFIYLALKPTARKWESYILMAFWICPILTILGASSRGSQIALVLQLILIFRKSLFKIKSLLGVLIFSALLLFLLPDEQKERFANTGSDKTSQQRLLYWKNGWEMMTDNPALGVGYFNFIPYYENYYSHDMLYKHAELPHNIFIQVGTDTGFIGLFFYLMIIIHCLYGTRKIAMDKSLDTIWRAIAAGLGYGVFGFVVAGQFVTVTYYPFLWISLSLIVCLQQITCRLNKHTAPNMIKTPINAG